MRITPFGLLVGLVIVPFVILPIVASVGAALLLIASESVEGAIVVFFVGLTGGAGIIFGTVRWFNHRIVNPPAPNQDGPSIST